MPPPRDESFNSESLRALVHVGLVHIVFPRMRDVQLSLAKKQCEAAVPHRHVDPSAWVPIVDGPGSRFKATAGSNVDTTPMFFVASSSAMQTIPCGTSHRGACFK